MSDERWQFYFDIGIMAAVRCTWLAVPLMRQAEWGRVINISSEAAQLGLPMEAPYMAAKAGLNALQEHGVGARLRKHPGQHGHAESVQLGRDRQFMEMSGVTDRYDPENLAAIWNWMRDVNGRRHGGTIGRVGLANELSPLLLLLGSPANSYIVGANIPVDAGTDFSSG